jgi:hypothetical protein
MGINNLARKREKERGRREREEEREKDRKRQERHIESLCEREMVERERSTV